MYKLRPCDLKVGASESVASSDEEAPRRGEGEKKLPPLYKCTTICTDLRLFSPRYLEASTLSFDFENEKLLAVGDTFGNGLAKTPT